MFTFESCHDITSSFQQTKTLITLIFTQNVMLTFPLQKVLLKLLTTVDITFPLQKVFLKLKWKCWHHISIAKSVSQTTNYCWHHISIAKNVSQIEMQMLTSHFHCKFRFCLRKWRCNIRTRLKCKHVTNRWSKCYVNQHYI